MDCVDDRFRVADQQRRKLVIMGCRRYPARLRQMAQAFLVGDPRQAVRTTFARAVGSIFEVPEALGQYGAAPSGRAKRRATSASRRVKLAFRASAISSIRSRGYLAYSCGRAGMSIRFTSMGTPVRRTSPAASASASPMPCSRACTSCSTCAARVTAASPDLVGSSAPSIRSNNRVPSTASAAASRRATVV